MPSFYIGAPACNDWGVAIADTSSSSARRRMRAKTPSMDAISRKGMTGLPSRGREAASRSVLATLVAG